VNVNYHFKSINLNIIKKLLIRKIILYLDLFPSVLDLFPYPSNDCLVLWPFLFHKEFHYSLELSTFSISDSKTGFYAVVNGKLLSCIHFIWELLDICDPFMNTAFPNSSWESFSFSKWIVLRLIPESCEISIASINEIWLSFACNLISLLRIVDSHDEAPRYADVLYECIDCCSVLELSRYPVDNFRLLRPFSVHIEFHHSLEL